MKKKNLRIIFILLILLAGAAASGLAVYKYKVQLTPPSPSAYPVRGVDVSHHQGAIDWPLLSSQGISFAFIKATEGSIYQDENFPYNWEQAGLTPLAAGAYHFFSFDSPGITQAQNYIDTVGSLENKLPPVVDVEFYGSYDAKWASGQEEDGRPDKESVLTELESLLDALETHYGRKPILYTTLRARSACLDGRFDSYPLWIRNIYTSPGLVGIGDWVFWQYSDTEVMEGFQGAEKYIDMNVFHGDEKDWNCWLNQQ